MRHTIILLTLLLTLATGAQAAAQKHRHTPQAVLTDSAGKDAIDLFSDTTTVDTASGQSTVYGQTSYSRSYQFESDSFTGLLKFIFHEMDNRDLAGMLFVLGVLFIIFVLAPLLIIIALFYFINKRRKEKIRLAEMAMQNGQHIPDQLLNDRADNADSEYRRGLRQCFVGVGLMIFLGYAAGKVGFGVGALVFCIGLGKIVASRTGRSNHLT